MQSFLRCMLCFKLNSDLRLASNSMQTRGTIIIGVLSLEIWFHMNFQFRQSMLTLWSWFPIEYVVMSAPNDPPLHVRDQAA